MGRKIGIELEINLSKYINNRLYDELNNNIKHVLKKLFKNIRLSEPFFCSQCEKGRKPDLEITHCGVSKFLSVKTGCSKTVHEESLQTCIPFLRGLGISKETLKTILLFHFGDNTLNGTGKIRQEYSEIIVKLRTQIFLANIELNKNKEVIWKIIDRFLFSGRGTNEPSADAIYHGTIEHGACCTKEDIKYYLNKKSFNYLTNLHFGPLLISPKARYVNFIEKNPENRFKISIGWPNMVGTLAYIDDRY